MKQKEPKLDESLKFLELMGDAIDEELKVKLDYPYGKLLGSLIDALSITFFHLNQALIEKQNTEKKLNTF